MCGLVGILNLDGAPVDPETLRRMTGLLAHRGPDDEGIFVDGPLGLGFRRLSIIDLSPAGHQPMQSPDGALTIVFNGEIYNHRELRAAIEADGVELRSRSDTEVLLALYRRHGEAMLERLRGMFALAIWDAAARRLFLARDRIGIKPLYTVHLPGRLFGFASEVKALLADPRVPREVEPRALLQYTLFSHSFAPLTMFRGVEKLEAAHCLTADGRGPGAARRYWDLLDRLDPALARSSGAGVVREGLRDAVRSHMVSDVPVGAFLSGGVDSSAVVAFMSDFARPVQTFSAGFDAGGSYDELGAARLVAETFGTRHFEQILSYAEAAELVQKLAWHYDEPFADAAAVPTYLIARFARQHVKVVMSGEGSDELFAGYRRYVLERIGAAALHLPPAARRRLGAALGRGRGKIARRLGVFLAHDGAAERYGHSLVQSPRGEAQILRPEVLQAARGYDPFWKHRACFERAARLDPLNRILYTDLLTWLPDTYLEKLDKATMAVGLEGRVPFLDHPLVERAFSLPGAAKLRGLVTKYPLKRAMLGKLPWRILARPKHGFSVPVAEWLRGPLRDFARDHLLAGRPRWTDWLDTAAVRRTLDDHLSGRASNETPIWILLNFELWLRHYRPGA